MRRAIVTALATLLLATGLTVPGAAAPATPRSVDAACPPGATGPAFSDVPADSVHARSVDCVLAWGVTRGMSPGVYGPDGHVTRAQMASFFRRVIAGSGGQLPASAPDAFDDDGGDTHEPAIDELAAVGIVAGMAPRRYGPALHVSRAQMASFLVRTYEKRTGRSLSSGVDAFSDDDGNTHETAINKAATAGLTGGTGVGYEPDRPVRRDQMATFLSRLLDLLVEQGFAAPRTAVVEGPDGVRILVPSAAFPDGSLPRVTVGEPPQPFPAALASGGNPPVVSVTAARQPAAPVQIVMPYDPAEVPEGTAPSVFYFDEELALWLPVATIADPQSGRLVATVDHFTDFTRGFLRALDGGLSIAENGVDWLSYQVGDAVGGRTDAPTCDPAPSWVLSVESYVGTMPRNAPLFACAGPVAGDEAAAELRAALNRPYSVELDLSEPATAVSLRGTVGLVDAAGQAITGRIGSSPGHVLLPARAEARITFAQPDDAERITATGRITPRSVLLDAVMSTLEVGTIFADHELLTKAAALDCAAGVLEQSMENVDPVLVAGAWTKIAGSCLEPVAEVTADAALGRVAKAVGVGLLAGRAGQAVWDGSRWAIAESHTVTVTVAPALALPPASAFGRNTPISATGAGPVTSGMTVRQAEQVTGREWIIEDFDTWDGTCYFALPRGLEDTFLALVESPSAPGDARDGVITRVSTYAQMGMPAQTDSAIGIGSSLEEVRQVYGSRMTTEPHAYTDGMYVNIDEPDMPEQRLRLELGDGRTVDAIHGGFIESVSLVEGCA